MKLRHEGILRRVLDGAAIHQQKISLLWRVNNVVAVLCKLPNHELTIGNVVRTPEGLDIDAFRTRNNISLLLGKSTSSASPSSLTYGFFFWAFLSLRYLTGRAPSSNSNSSSAMSSISPHCPPQLMNILLYTKVMQLHSPLSRNTCRKKSNLTTWSSREMSELNS